jgi:hypothetical protein
LTLSSNIPGPKKRKQMFKNVFKKIMFLKCFLFFGPGMKTVQPIENERKENQPMND